MVVHHLDEQKPPDAMLTVIAAIYNVCKIINANQGTHTEN